MFSSPNVESEIMNITVRDKTIESLRGVDKYLILLRIIFSNAAPIFVFISGYMNAIQDSSSRNLK